LARRRRGHSGPDGCQWGAGRTTTPDEHEEDSTVVLSSWHYLGSGYLNPGDALLAAGVEASLRAARGALLDVRRGRPPNGGPGG
jgi:hypothetical protein